MKGLDIGTYNFPARRTRTVFAILLLILTIIGGLFYSATNATAADTVSLVVKLVDGLTPAEQAAVIARDGGTETSSIPALRLHVITVATVDLPLVQQNYQADAQVASVELNKMRQAEGVPTDSQYGVQWALPKISWDSVFGTVTPAGSARIALLDTGIDATHPDLTGTVIPGTSILDGSNGLTDPNGHGTTLAGIVAAVTNNNVGIAGVSFAGVGIMPVTVLNAGGIGQDSDIIAGILWAADNGADVILMGFSNPDFSQNLQDAIDYAWSKGAVLVSATGNSGVSAPTFPAGDRGVIGVSATDSNDILASGSNYGQDTFLAAPGANIYTTGLNASYSYISGTSASSAIVSGVAAFMKAVDPSLSNGIIVGRLGRSADAIGTAGDPNNPMYFGNGRVNMANALADSGVDFIQPAGAAPVGGGGPYVGPYTAAALSITNISPNSGTTLGGTSLTITGTGFASGQAPFTVTFGGFVATSITRTDNTHLAVTTPAHASGSVDVVVMDKNNSKATQSSGFTYNKVDQTITFAALVNKTYGNAPFNVSATASSDLPVSFTVTGNCSVSGNIVTISGAGSCTVTANQSGDSNYNAATPVPKSFNIAKATLTVTANNASRVFGAADPAFLATYSGFVGSDNFANSVTGTSSLTTNATTTSTPGTYTITAAIGTLAAANYNFNFVDGTLTVGNADQTINFAALTGKIYGDAPFTLNATASSGLSVSYAASGSCTVSANTVTITGAASCTITAKQAGDSNYNAATDVPQSFTVSKKDASVSPTVASKTYGDADPALTGMLNGFLAGDNVTATYSRTTGEGVSGGPYTISATLSPAGVLGNYNITSNTAGFTINKLPIAVAADAKSKTYGDPDSALTYKITSGSLVNGDSFTGSLTRVAGETVAGGPYEIQQGTLALNANYALTYSGASLTINKKDASVAPAAASKTYGDADPALSGTLTGFLAADSVTATYSRTAGETVAGNPYTISATLSPAGVLGNYNITSNTASFTINKKAASVTPTAASKTYGDADPALSGTQSGFLAGDNVTANYSRAVGETVAGSPYTISATLAPAGALGNYDITYNTASFTINKKAASVTPTAASKTYGGTDPSLSGTQSGFLAGDYVKAIYTRTAGETAGSYTISAVLTPAGALGNYDITYNTASFTINKKTVSVTPTAASKILGAADPTLTGTLVGFLASDNVTASYNRIAGEAVGAYTISATLAPASVLGNYDITYKTAMFNIYFNWPGFLQPINDTAHQVGTTQSSFKRGQTVPAKFVLQNAAGSVVQQTGNPTFTRSGNLGSCGSYTTAETVDVIEADTAPVYTWDGSQYHYNWSTKGLDSGVYRIYANLADGTHQWVDICLSK